ncbi:MAG: ABC transporter substrate-binding protein [Bradymonadia bacterium]
MVILLRSRGARDIRKRGQTTTYLIVLVILLTYASAAAHPTNIQVAVDTMRDPNKPSELRARSAQAVLRYSRHTGDRYLSRESARLLNHLSKPEIGRAPSQTCRIGVIGPFSGKYSTLGEVIRKTLGGSVKAHKLPLVFADTKGTPAGARLAVKQLVDQGAALIIGGLGRHESLAAAIAAGRLDVPYVSLSSHPAVETIDTNTFRFRCNLADKSARLAQHAARDLGLQHAAVIYTADESGRRALASFWRTYEAEGGKIVAAEAYSGGDSRSLSGAISATLGRKHTRYRRRSKHWAKLNAKSRHAGHKVSPIIDYQVLVLIGPGKDANSLGDYMRFWDVSPKRLGHARGRKQIQLMAVNYTRAGQGKPPASGARADIIFAQCGPVLQVPTSGYPELAAHALALSLLIKNKLGTCTNMTGGLRSKSLQWTQNDRSVIQPRLYLRNQFGRLDPIQ